MAGRSLNSRLPVTTFVMTLAEDLVAVAEDRDNVRHGLLPDGLDREFHGREAFSTDHRLRLVLDLGRGEEQGLVRFGRGRLGHAASL